MKITEAKLRKMIRGVIREFTTSGTGTSDAKHKGYQSKGRKSAQKTYDTAAADYDTKNTDYKSKQSALAAFDLSKKFRKAKSGKGGGYDYFSTPGPKGSGRQTNPDWLTKDTAKTMAGRNRDAAATVKNTASTTLDTAKEDDLRKEVPTQKSQTGGGKGKSKGKKKKN